MSRLSPLLDQRVKIVSQFAEFSGALAGNISKSRVPPHTGKYYWRLTWKEKQKTKVQYIRPEEYESFRDGVNQFAKLRKAVLRLGSINREIILLQRGNK
jgi:hypothetical protein